MTELFNRTYKIQVDDFTTDKLDFDAKIVKTLKKQPNTLELNIYNLNPDHRARLAKKKNVVVQLEAGYIDRYGTLFLGDVEDVYSVYEKPNWVTVLSSGDGEKSNRFDRINRSFAPGTSVATVIKKMAQALNIDPGNVVRMASRARLLEAGDTFVGGHVASGNGVDELDKVIRGAGFEWSVQDNKLQLLLVNQSLESEAVLLTPQTGLVDSPSVSADGIVNFKSLLNSDIVPGRQVALKTRTIDSFFRAEVVEYSLSTAGQEWYAICEGKELVA